MTKKLPYVLAIIMVLTGSLRLNAQKSPEEKLNMTMYAIMNMYVDSIDKSSFVNDVIARTVSVLDPFSTYLTPEQARLNENALLGPSASGILDSPDAVTVIPSWSEKDKIGYIRVTMFAQSTPEEFRSAVEALKEKGMKSMILDLRSNPGGFVESALAMADEFLSEGRAIMTTSGAHIPTQTAEATAGGCFEKGDAVLLIDANTMSAAEIFAGALRDWDRAVLVGERTFGKGLIQETLPFEDGSALRITVARYLTPCGMTIQKPYQGYGGVHADTTSGYVSLVNARPLASGGGISPDVEVQQNSSSQDTVLSKAVELLTSKAHKKILSGRHSCRHGNILCP